MAPLFVHCSTTPQGRFMLTVFGAPTELERENILERLPLTDTAAAVNGIQAEQSLRLTKIPLGMIPMVFLLLAEN